MAKFNISVDIDWVGECGTLDQAIQQELVAGVAQKIMECSEDSLMEKVTEELNKKLNTAKEDIAQRLNAMMDEFFDTPRDITDNWGTVKRSGVTARQLITEAADNFFTEKVDDNGNPDTYKAKYTRIEYIARKAVNHDITWAVENAVSKAVDQIKRTVTDTASKKLGERLAAVANLDEILGV